MIVWRDAAPGGDIYGFFPKGHERIVSIYRPTEGNPQWAVVVRLLKGERWHWTTDTLDEAKALAETALADRLARLGLQPAGQERT